MTDQTRTPDLLRRLGERERFERALNNPKTAEVLRDAASALEAQDNRTQAHDAVIATLRAESERRFKALWDTQKKIDAIRSERALNVEAIALFIEHLRDDYASTTEPVTKVARLVRERFGDSALTAPPGQPDNPREACTVPVVCDCGTRLTRCALCAVEDWYSQTGGRDLNG